uniref:Uncharacterized protein n=1 Tax=Setaria viridis TaxID=4556 RepID=A0A4U6U6D7_SETVI|nr:hypothetical protein SEVIR_7G199475v2 [Setaria viridis]
MRSLEREEAVQSLQEVNCRTEWLARLRRSAVNQRTLSIPHARRATAAASSALTRDAFSRGARTRPRGLLRRTAIPPAGRDGLGRPSRQRRSPGVLCGIYRMGSTGGLSAAVEPPVPSSLDAEVEATRTRVERPAPAGLA